MKSVIQTYSGAFIDVLNPDPAPKPLVIVPVRLTPDALARLDELATASGVSRSAALTALVAGLFRPEPW